MDIKGSLKYTRLSVKKARPVVKLVNKVTLSKAENILKFQKTKAAKMILKLLKSVQASAKEKTVEMESLFIKEIKVDQGPSLKRRKIRSRGRADLIKRPTAHITIILSDHKKSKPKTKKTKIIKKKGKRIKNGSKS